jgi:hypothetical protein
MYQGCICVSVLATAVGYRPLYASNEVSLLGRLTDLHNQNLHVISIAQKLYPIGSPNGGASFISFRYERA